MELLFLKLLWGLALSICISSCLAIGMTIPPVVTGDQKKYSSLNNLMNCISYRTFKDDVILVTVDSGDRIGSQQLNLKVFDSENNILKSMEDMADEQTFMFTNLNNPTLLENIKNSNPKKPRDNYNDLMSVHSGKSYIYVCFDNIYFDKSWSFQKHSRDVMLHVSIRNITSLLQTNYNHYAKYFNQLNDPVDAKIDENNEFKLDFSEVDFDKAMDLLQTKLNEVSEELKSTEGIIKLLMDNESKLRDVNEAIYEDYTRTSIVLIACICIFGLCQIIYYKCYFTRRKLL